MSGPEVLNVYSLDNTQKATNEHGNNITKENHKNSELCTIKDNVTNSGKESHGENTSVSDCDEKSMQTPINEISIEVKNRKLKKELKRRKIFFQRKGNRYVQSFFDVIEKQQKTGQYFIYSPLHRTHSSD